MTSQTEQYYNQNRFAYVKSFIADKYVGAVSPSSHSVCQAICYEIDFARSKSILELGAGEGRLTRHLLSYLRQDGKLVAFEINQSLCNIYRSQISDRRQFLYPENAALSELICRKIKFKPDVIITGVPFKLIGEKDTQGILEQAFDLLESDGLLMTYQTWIPSILKSKNYIQPLMRYFRKLRSQIIWKNIPPLIITSFTKR